MEGALLRLIFLLALGAVSGIREEGFCRDLSCASKEDLLHAITSLRQDIVQKDAIAAESNCTACYSNPCLNGGVCKPYGATGYRCDCPDWAAGPTCEKNITCTAWSCGKNAQCYVANHQTNCICNFGFSGNPYKGCSFSSKKICFNGDPHFTTFDGSYYDYQSTCPFTYAVPCKGSLDGGYHYFRVKAKNELLHIGDTVSYVESVQVEMYNQTIYVDDKLRVYVNNIQVHIPFYYPSSTYPKISVNLRGRDIVIKNDEFVEVDFTNTQLCLVVPNVPAFQGSNTICGLAGNLDKDCNDDLTKPDGTVVPVKRCRPTQAQADEFGDSWRTTDYPSFGSNEACIDGWTMTNKSSTCNLQNAVADCQSIFNAQLGKGPFAGCEPLGNETIQLAYDSCMYDVCRDKNLKCPALVDFVHSCQFQIPEVKIDGWRDSEKCTIHCGLHSTYSTCVSSCPATCADHDIPDLCDQPCSEGCACDYGYVLDQSNIIGGVSCIAVENCGCADDSGNFHLPGKDNHWLTRACTQDNYCLNGTYHKEPYNCSPYGHCIIDQSQYQCKCDTGFKGNGTYCEDINECLDPTTCGADKGQGTCVNTIGSYNCICKPFYDGHDCDKYAPKRHCADLRKYWAVSNDGAYKVYPPLNSTSAGTDNENGLEDDETNAVLVYCDMATDGGGWTLVSNALTNSSAARKFADYVAGFGDPTTKDAWIGLNLLHFYTNYQASSLRLNLYRCTHNGIQGKWTDCTYDSFTVLDKTTGYQVNIPKVCHGTEIEYYDGWARWDLSKPGPKFVSYDNDNSTAHCSETFRQTGWWFDTSYRCGSANLNGVRYTCDNIPVGIDGQTYLYWSGDPINKAEMWLRPFNYPNYDKN